VPSIVIVAFIILMNKAGGLRFRDILVAVALAGAFLTANTTSAVIYMRSVGTPMRRACRELILKRYILRHFV